MRVFLLEKYIVVTDICICLFHQPLCEGPIVIDPCYLALNVCIWNKMLHISYIYYFYFHVCLSRYMFLYSCRLYRLACLLNDMITFTLFYQKFRYLSLNQSIWYICQRKLKLLNLNNIILEKLHSNDLTCVWYETLLLR